MDKLVNQTPNTLKAKGIITLQDLINLLNLGWSTKVSKKKHKDGAEEHIMLMSKAW